jgi:thioredoxin 1
MYWSEQSMEGHNGKASSLVVVTDGEFDAQVLESDKPVLLDFWAAWCGPCKMIEPVLDELAREQSTLTIGKLDVDANPGTAMRYGVQSIPTLILFKHGQEAERIVGFMPKERLLARLMPHLPAAVTAA